MAQDGRLYVAHIEPKVAHAGHYVGWTGGPVERRWATHLKGDGSPLIRAAVERGCSVTFTDLGPGTRHDERRLHNRHGAAGFCPTCKAAQRAGRKAVA